MNVSSQKIHFYKHVPSGFKQSWLHNLLYFTICKFWIAMTVLGKVSCLIIPVAFSLQNVEIIFVFLDWLPFKAQICFAILLTAREEEMASCLSQSVLNTTATIWIWTWSVDSIFPTDNCYTTYAYEKMSLVNISLWNKKVPWISNCDIYSHQIFVSLLLHHYNFILL